MKKIKGFVSFRNVADTLKYQELAQKKPIHFKTWKPRDEILKQP